MEPVIAIGHYECKLDAKGRLPFPADLRRQLSAVLHDGFVLKRSVFQPCLELYTRKEWDGVMGKINQLNRFVKKNNDFIRLYTAGVKVLDLDANQRIQISKDLLQYAGLKKDLVMSTAGSVIEIWDKEQYENALTSVEDFGALAEEVMGNLSQNDLS